MRKTTLRMVLALIFCAALGTAACAEGRVVTLLEGSRDVLPGNYYEDMVLADGTLFVLDFNQQEIIPIDMQSMEEGAHFSTVQQVDNQGEITYQEVRVLFLMEGKLHAVFMNYKIEESGFRKIDGAGLYSVSASGDAMHCEWVAELDLKEYIRFVSGWGEDLPEIVGVERLHEWMYLLTYTPQEGVQLLRASMTGGVPEKVDAPVAIERILRADADGLLVATTDGQEWSIGRYDPNAASYEEKIRLSVSAEGFAVDSEFLYWSEDGRVYRAALDGSADERELVGSVPLLRVTRGVLMGPDVYLAASDTKVVRVALEKQQTEPITLNVCGGVSDAWILAHMEEHPNITIHSEYLENDAIIDCMLTKSDAVDVLILDSETSCYETLLNRGYLKALDSSELSGFVNSTYEYIQAACKREGEICAIPVRWYAQQVLPAVNAEKAREFAFDVPTSWEELLDIASDWNSNPLSEKICLFQAERPDEVRLLFLQYLLTNYQLWREASGNNAKFSDEAFLSLIRQAQNLPSEADGDKLCTKEFGNALFQLGKAISLRAEEEWTVVPFGISAGDSPVLGCNIQFACVSPYSGHVMEAMDFLETISENLEAEHYASMIPTRNEPIVAKWYPGMVKQSEEEISALRKKIEAANETDRAELERNLASLEAHWAKTLPAQQYAATEESIRAFREYGDDFVIVRPSWLSRGGNQFLNNTQRFLEGSLPAEEYLSFLDQQIAMDSLEGI